MSVNWLPLTEYSSKYKVSISTLRRRIKADDIEYQFTDGKYLISDSPLGTRQGLEARPSQDPEHRPSLKDSSLTSTQVEKNLSYSEDSHTTTMDEPILTAANRLLSELKKAYTLILQEKEEQILQLKDEVADLKTLVRVLESDNERLRQRN